MKVIWLETVDNARTFFNDNLFIITFSLELNISLFLALYNFSRKRYEKYLQGEQLKSPKFQLYKRWRMSWAPEDAQICAFHTSRAAIVYRQGFFLPIYKIKYLMPHLRLVQSLGSDIRFANWYTNMVWQLAKVELSTYSSFYSL